MVNIVDERRRSSQGIIAPRLALFDRSAILLALGEADRLPRELLQRRLMRHSSMAISDVEC
jgi:hypothetical protein